MPALTGEDARKIAKKRLKLMVAQKYDCDTKVLWNEFQKQIQALIPEIIEKVLAGQKTCIVKLELNDAVKKEVESFYQREISKAWKHVFKSYGYGIADIPT